MPILILSILLLLVATGLAAGIGVLATRDTRHSNPSADEDNGSSASTYGNITMGCSDDAAKVNKTSFMTHTFHSGDSKEGMSLTCTCMHSKCPDFEYHRLLLFISCSKVKSANFTIYCHMNANGDDLFSIFARDLEGCLEACNHWDSPSIVNGTRCGAVTFAPAWSNYSLAFANDAPGNCFLKPFLSGEARVGAQVNDFELVSALLDDTED